MKNRFFASLIFAALLIGILAFGSPCAVAKDKEKDKASEKPVFSPETKLAVATAQRDLANGIVQAQPAEIRVNQLKQNLDAVIKKAMEGVDTSKWQPNWNTLELEAKPDEKSSEKSAPAVYDGRPPSASVPEKSEPPKEQAKP